MNLMKTPRSADIAITNECNLRCKYCSFFTSAGNTGQDLPKEEWLKFFEELNQCAVMRVTLQGGEPFSRQDLKKIIEGIILNRMRFNILSNGTLITNETAAFLASTKRCEKVQVSIDSSIPIMHDAYRGKGSFSKAMDGINFLMKHNVPIDVRVTIHKKNITSLNDTTKLLLDEIGLPSFSINAASYMGLCRKNTEKVQLDIKEKSSVMKTLLELNEKYNGRIKTSAGPLYDARQWLKMKKKHDEGKEKRGYLTGCGGVFKEIAVRADGTIVPCIQMSHIEIGQINRDILQDIWENHPELKRLRSRRDIPLSSFEFCHQCNYIDYCTGGCPAIAYTMLGNDSNPSPNGCFKRFIIEGGRLPDEKSSII